jgi:hypothetical protein
MEFDHFSAKENDLMKKPPPPSPAKTIEHLHPLRQLSQVLGNHAFTPHRLGSHGCRPGYLNFVPQPVLYSAFN